MRIGTVSIGRIGGIGDCVQDVDGSGICPDGSVYTGTMIDLSTAPNYAGEYTQLTTNIPLAPDVTNPVLSGQGPLAPGQKYLMPTLAPGAAVAAVCPAGYYAQNGVCVAGAPGTAIAPTSPTIISGVPNALLYAGIGFALLIAMSAGGSVGRRR